MDKINYNQHDWNKGEVIKEENLDNMENGIKQATDKINEIIDTEQDFKDRMADIDGRIDINNEELVIARDGCDNLGQRIERDQQYIYNILNDGSYLEFNGTDITVDHAKNGYTKDTIIKGQTYQNLFDVKNIKGDWSFPLTIEADGTSHIFAYSMPLAKPSNTYTIIIDVSNNTKNNNFTVTGWNSTLNQPDVVGTGILKYTLTTRSNDAFSTDWNMELWRENTQGSITINSLIILEGDWTNKEVPYSITGIESVGEKEDNKISILSHNKNINIADNYVSGCLTDSGFDSSNSYYISNINYIPVKPNTKYYMLSNAKATDIVFMYDKSKKCIGQTMFNNFEFTTIENCYYIRYRYIKKQIVVDMSNLYTQITETKTDLYEPCKEDKKEILLPLDGGLKSLPNGVADTIEQREDGVYLVQRIKKFIYSDSMSFIYPKSQDSTDTVLIYFMNERDGVINSKNLICNALIPYEGNADVWNTSVDSPCIVLNHNSDLLVRIDKSKLSSLDNDGISKYLLDNNFTVYYPLATPIETKLDIDTLNLETFKDKTYISSKNNIKPEIVCKAPVDVNQTIADLQEEQEQLIETYNTLKEENEAVKTAISELNEQEDVQTADMLDLDMRVLALEEGLE